MSKLLLMSKPSCKIGHIQVYENIAIFGTRGILDLGNRIRKQCGEYLGTVLALIPVDESRVLYQRLTHTESYWRKKNPDRRYPQTKLFGENQS